MNRSRIHVRWKADAPVARFRTGVSLHSHTLHSRESLTFIYKAAATTPVLATAVRRGEERYRKLHGSTLDLSRGWWTPPLGAHEAWALERNQIEGLDLKALVSLTDHDNIEAPVSLQVVEECRGVPVAFEWTVPFGPTFFHLGVHGVPRADARRWFGELEEYTQRPRPQRLPELMEALARVPETLVIFNHPLWDENRIGAELHRQTAVEFVDRFGPYLHAVELNGLRPWRENRAVIAFAEAARKPVISGGDRHGSEPNANLNLTNATSFEDFAGEVRCGWSEVLFMPHYRENHVLRILHNMTDILGTHENHAKGWKLWSDRVFYRCDDGRVRSLTELFGSKPPVPVGVFLGMVRLASRPPVRRLLREAFSTGEGVGL